MSKDIIFKNKNNEEIYPHPYYPIGSIYLSIVNINPCKWFGGTWQLISQGKTLVGVDTSQTEFNTVKKSGGSKYTEKHTHIQNPHNHNINFDQIWNYGGTTSIGTTSGGPYGGSGFIQNAVATNKDFGEGNSGNLQPYFTCYIWCRIS